MTRWSIALAVIALDIAACGGTPVSSPDNIANNDPDPQYGDLVRSNLPRNTAPDASESDLAALVAGNRAFAMDMYQRLASQDGNLFFSPASISQALAMTYAGARGDTETQMADALHFDLPQAQLHPAYNSLDLELASRGDGAQGADGEGFRLHIANALWGQTGYGFVDAFLDVLAVNYDAGMRLLDFWDDAEGSRITINAWVSEQTEERIPELLQQGDILPATRLVLTNTIYFNAAWEYVFPEELSSTGLFHLPDGSTVSVDTMSLDEELSYAAGEGYQAVELPYDGGELSMVVIVPDAGRFDEIQTALDPAFLDDVESSMATEYIVVTLPKWSFDTRFKARSALQALGMTDAFESYADFSGINGATEPLWIDDVIHQAFVSVNEYGTEAAAATAVVMVGGGLPTPVKVDRPFLFVIRDNPTGALLFVGRVLNPAP